MEQPNFYGIVPAPVRYCEGLTPNAKLLYCEISALCNARGHCWAGNEYFAKLFRVSNWSISNWISQLSEKGFIKVKIDKTSGNQRFIRLNESAPLLRKFQRPIEKIPKTSLENSHDPHVNFPIQNNTLNTTFNNVRTAAKKMKPSASSVDALSEQPPPFAAPPPTPFSESGWANNSFWSEALISCGAPPDSDFSYYFLRCQTWSNGGKKVSDWPAFAAGIILDDARQGKIKKVTENASNTPPRTAPQSSDISQRALARTRRLLDRRSG